MNALDREAVIELFTELGNRLHAQNLTATIYVFGGAAMLLHGLRTFATEDIDVSFRRNLAVKEIAKQMTADFGLGEHWISESGTSFIPSPDRDVMATEQHFGALTVRVASVELLLAQKLTAWRAKDLGDIDALLKANAITHAQDAVAVVARYYGEDSVPAVDLEQIAQDVASRLHHGGTNQLSSP